jgi:hypothetical protein
MIKTPIIHIGFHKTGTTYLQKNVFENFPKKFNRISQTEIRQKIILPSPFRYDENIFKKIINNADERRLVLSSEFISSGLHKDDFRSKTNADRIKALVPEAKIIIGVREQLSMITSAYNQYLKARGSHSIQQYIIPPISKIYKFEHLQYHHLVKYYIELFGKENVLVLPYEILKQDPKLYLQTVFNFIDEPKLINDIKFDIKKKVNSSLKPCVLNIKKYFNPFIMKNFPEIGNTYQSSLVSGLFSLIKKILMKIPTSSWDKKITQNISKVISETSKGRFEDSNRALNDLVDFDLQKLGYKL